MKTTLALVPQLPPRYLCGYAEEINAIATCDRLRTYGIDAKVFPPVSLSRWTSTFRVMIMNPEDYNKAVEFKRGLQAVLAIRGDVGAFADGVLAGAVMRNPRRDKKMIAAKQLRLKA